MDQLLTNRPSQQLKKINVRMPAVKTAAQGKADIPSRSNLCQLLREQIKIHGLIQLSSIEIPAACQRGEFSHSHCKARITFSGQTFWNLYAPV
jgi:hypothetical protein